MMVVDLESTPILFAVALFAMFPEARQETERATEIAVPLKLDAWAILASSPDEAQERGRERALELWPTSEGWFGHSARVAEIRIQYDVPAIAENSIEERIM